MPHFHLLTPRLPVLDLKRTMGFYTNTLGFQVDVFFPEDQPTFCILNRDQVSVGFFVTDHCRPAATVGTGELYIEVQDAKGLHADLKDKVPIEWGPEVYFYGRREFAFRDPNGYLIIITEPTDDPVTCSEE